jgi:hypothetical protein
MIPLESLTPQLVVASLRSPLCPSCAGPKKPGQTLCYKEYRRLPHALQNALYDRVGDGYEQALHTALAHLKAQTFHAPGQGGRCSRTPCARAGATCQSIKTDRMYCEPCARELNRRMPGAVHVPEGS